jgi:hypothetical protein
MPTTLLPSMSPWQDDTGQVLYLTTLDVGRSYARENAPPR